MKRFRSVWKKKADIRIKGQKDHLGLKIALLAFAVLLAAGAVYYFAFYLPASAPRFQAAWILSRFWIRFPARGAKEWRIGAICKRKR